MAKTPIVPGSPIPTYPWADGKSRTYPQPTSGGEDKLLTLKSSNIGNSTYKYLDWQARYRGGFRVQAYVGGAGSGNTLYSRGAMGFKPAVGANPAGLILQGEETLNIAAEFAIPTPLNVTSRSQISSLPIAAARQNFANMLRGTSMVSPLSAFGPRLAGMYSNGTQMICSIYSNYEQSGTRWNTTHEVFRDVNALSSSVVDGWMKTNNPTWSVGPIAPIPLAYQSALGGTHCTGWSGSTERASTQSLSMGPAFAAFNANDMMTNSASIGTGTVTFNRAMRHELYGVLAPTDDALYNYDDATSTVLNNYMWTHISEISAMYIFPGTKTVMYMGGSGGHNYGLTYGTPPWDPDGYKGHVLRNATDIYAYYWLVSIDDLIAVRNGTLAYNMVIPYEVGDLWMPFQPTPGTAAAFYVKGMGIDETNNLLYLSMAHADDSQGPGDPPLICVFDATGL